MDKNVRETVIQFGGGVFLRSFADYFFDILNKKGLYDGKIVIVQPLRTGPNELINAQRGSYNLFLRGLRGGEPVEERTLVESVSRGLNPYEDYAAFLALARNPDMRVIISNTTEAGIEYVPCARPDAECPRTFPAKLTALLYERFRAGLPGFIVLPCELIDDNAGKLCECVQNYARDWALGADFETWISDENDFCNTLVDRICTGYPKDSEEAARLEALCPGDRLIDTAEIFALWVIEGDHSDELPFAQAGINVVWTRDVSPYKKRKVRILNGLHTSMVPGAYLYGLRTVGECMSDPTVRGFAERVVRDEILPVLGDSAEDRGFAADVFARFGNPYIKHQLLAIALNSAPKFRVRVLPTMLEYAEKFGRNPRALCFSLASLIAFYKKGEPNDAPEITEKLRRSSAAEILSDDGLWGQNISQFLPEVERSLGVIMNEPSERWYECAK